MRAMRVDVDASTGKLAICVPSSGPDDHIDIWAERDLVVSVTVCSSEDTNQGRLKPIAVRVFGSD